MTTTTAAGPGITGHLIAAQTRLDEITRRSAVAEVLRYLRPAALGDERLLRDDAPLAVTAEHVEAGLHRSPPLSGGQLRRIATLTHPRRQTAASGARLSARTGGH